MPSLNSPLPASSPIARHALWLRRELGGLVLVAAIYSAAPPPQEVDRAGKFLPFLLITKQ